MALGEQSVDTEPRAYRSAAEGAQRAEAHAKILIVDDDPAFRRLCKEYLGEDSRTSYDVCDAENGAEAMALCSTGTFDCLLIDYNLPDSSGTTLLRELRHSCGPLTPMILLTGIGSEEVAMEALRAGAADYVPKNRVSETSLGRAIFNALERARLLRSIEDRNQRLQRANDELQRKTDQIQRFYHAVSHEIKTPLTAAREFVSLVADGVYGGLTAEQSEALGFAMESCDQIAAHFNELIEVSRLDTGKLRLEKSPCAPQHLVTLSLASVRAAATAKNLTLNEIVAGGLPPLDVDGSRIVQVLSNLLGNAEKFTEAGGEIAIAAMLAPGGNAVVFAVSDTGCGIPATELPRIFDRLYQVTAHADSLSTRGLGLGLSIAHEIVALHGGDIAVESQLGRGSTFSVRLPLTAATTGEAA